MCNELKFFCLKIEKHIYFHKEKIRYFNFKQMGLKNNVDINIRSLLIILLLFFLIGNSTTGFSQLQKPFDSLYDDISQKLPPLNDLIDSALLNDPYVRFRDLQIIVNKSKLNAEKSYWLRNIGFQSDVRYGTFNMFSTNTSEGQSPDLTATQQSQVNYGVGAYIKIPILDIVNRKNQIQLAENEIEQAKSMAEFQKNEVRQLVIVQYNDLILKQKLLKIKAKHLALTQSNVNLAEKEFKNGVSNLSEYSRISGIYSDAETEYETARIDFITSYMILEEIVGIKLEIASNQ